MNRQLLAVGLGLTTLGLVGLVVLALGGVLRHPAEAAETYAALDVIAITGSVVALAVGVVVTFRSFVEIPADGA
ncbi:hypothetical protein OB905_10320 [Halobacteria archaeon AArc-dxtr1]|nr:hypothetical protein [Halobacteria archaeon AArc-dxtr1]